MNQAVLRLLRKWVEPWGRSKWTTTWRRVANCWALGAGLLAGSARAQTPTSPPQPLADTVARVPAPVVPAGPLAGVWNGPLAIPGGSLLIQIIILQSGANKLIASLDLPAKRLNRIPASVTERGDSLVFYAPAADCRFVCQRSADGQELRGRWAQPGLRVPLSLHRATGAVALAGARAGARAKALAPVVTTYHIEVVTITSQPGSVALAGTLSIPDGPGPFPAAVLLSDMGAQDRDTRQGQYRFFAQMASYLARQGVAVLRLDDRGVGKSGGSLAATTTADLVHDAQAGLTYLRLRPTLDPARTGLIGHGEGGNVALLAAAQPVPPTFVVALAASGLVGQELLANQPEPITTPADTALVGAARRQTWAEALRTAEKLRNSGSNSAQVEMYLAQQRLKAKTEERKQAEATLKFRRAMFEIVRQTANADQAQSIVVNMLRQRYPTLDPAVARTRAGEFITPWFRYYLKFDPQPTLSAVTCPVLLLHGTSDPEVNIATNLPALEKGLKANKRVTVRRFPGVNHWFQGPAGAPDTPEVAPVVLETLRDWVLQRAEN